MSTAVTTQSPPKITDREVNYIPLGGKTSVQITVGMVRSYLCTPTKQGNIPNDSDIVKFMMLCKARELDPWVGDAYLTGYDTQDGPSFSLITAAQALLKRAEMNEQYDGMESGVVVKSAEGGIQYRDGDLVLDGETLVSTDAKTRRRYKIKDDIPIMLIDESEVLDESEWKAIMEKYDATPFNQG